MMVVGVGVTVAVVIVIVVVAFYCAGDAQAWTRQAPWYVPCAQSVCVVCHEFATCVNLCCEPRADVVEFGVVLVGFSHFSGILAWT